MIPGADPELLFRQVIEGLGQPFYAVDRDWRVILYNDEAARHFGRPAADVLGRRLWDIFPGESDHERGRLLREAMASRRVVRGEAQSMMAPRLISYRLFPLGDGLGVVLSDVSDRRDAQQALGERSAELAAVLDTIPTAVWFTYDREAREVVRNRRAIELLRLPQDDGPPLAVVPHRTFRYQRNGQDIAPDEMPLRRAARGETVDNELLDLVHDDGDRRVLLMRAVPLRRPDGSVIGAVCAAADVTERHRYEGRLRLLVDELNHRAKNTLAVVQSLAKLTLKNLDTPSRQSFEERLFNLAQVHDLLTQDHWTGAELGDVLGSAIRAVFPAENRVILEGPGIRLHPRTAISLSMAAHELATNAIKYGALSAASGCVSVRWSTDGGRFVLTWEESNGPTPTPPTRRGFGTRMIGDVVAKELEGNVRFDYRAGGLVCTIEGSLAALRASPGAG
jgi:PAS domain S-box-containing protein